MKRKICISLNIAGVLLICLIIAACSSPSSLGIYQGSLKDLIPEKVNGYNRGYYDFISEAPIMPAGERVMFNPLGATGALETGYEYNRSRIILGIMYLTNPTLSAKILA